MDDLPRLASSMRPGLPKRDVVTTWHRACLPRTAASIGQAIEALYAYGGRDGDRLTDVAQALVRLTLAPDPVPAALH